MQIKTIIFDFFGVISCEVAPRWFGERFLPDEAVRLKNEKITPADRGDIDEEEMLRSLSRISGERPEDIMAEWLSIARINPEVTELIIRLRKNYKIVLLSNAPGMLLGRILMRDNLYPLFDQMVISCLEGKIKPEEPIYRLALKRGECTPEESIMIDDNETNIEAANRIGINGIVYRGIDDLKDRLLSLGIKI